jgi:hypothetical protein
MMTTPSLRSTGLCVIRGRRDPSAASQVCDCRQQLAGQTILGHEGVYQAQRSLRYLAKTPTCILTVIQDGMKSTF